MWARCCHCIALHKGGTILSQEISGNDFTPCSYSFYKWILWKRDNKTKCPHPPSQHMTALMCSWDLSQIHSAPSLGFAVHTPLFKYSQFLLWMMLYWILIVVGQQSAASKSATLSTDTRIMGKTQKELKEKELNKTWSRCFLWQSCLMSILAKRMYVCVFCTAVWARCTHTVSSENLRILPKCILYRDELVADFEGFTLGILSSRSFLTEIPPSSFLSADSRNNFLLISHKAYKKDNYSRC